MANNSSSSSYWKPVKPANSPDCEISGLESDSAYCYPKSNNPLLDYRKQRIKSPCSNQDICKLSTDDMIQPNAELQNPDIQIEREQLSNTEVVLTCLDIYGSDPVWKEMYVPYDVPPPSGEEPTPEIGGKVVIPAGTYTTWINKSNDPDNKNYTNYKASVQAELQNMAILQAYTTIECFLQNPEITLSCPDVAQGRPAIEPNTTTIAEGNTIRAILVPENTAPENYPQAANLPSLKQEILNNVYQTAISQIGCEYGNVTYTANCLYNGLLINKVIYVSDLTKEGTYIRYDLLASTELYIKWIEDTSSWDIALQPPSDATYVRAFKTAFGLKYIPNVFNYDPNVQAFNWSNTITDVEPVFEVTVFDATQVEHTFKLPVPLWIPDQVYDPEVYGLKDTPLQNFNTVKGSSLDYNDPVTAIGYPFATVSSDFTSTSLIRPNFEDGTIVDTDVKATAALQKFGTEAVNNATDFAKEQATSALICTYANNAMPIACPPGKILSSGESEIIIPAREALRDNLYEANKAALDIYISQLSFCSSGNIRILAFCDKITLDEFPKVSLGKYDIKSIAELQANYWDNVKEQYTYDEPVETLLIYKNHFCTGVYTCPTLTETITDPTTGDTTEVPVTDAVTSANCRAADYASISVYEVYPNQYSSATLSIKENNSSAIKLAIASISCLYGNLPTKPYTCEDNFNQYGITIAPQCTGNGVPPGSSCPTTGPDAPCVISINATAVEAGFYLSDDPCEASNMAARITLATRICLGCDKVGTPGSGQQVNVQVQNSSCTNCGAVCCWTL